MPKNICIVLISFFVWTFFCSFIIAIYKINKIDKSKISFDTISYMVNDTYFIQAYDEIVRMLEDKDSLSIKRAQFLMEWAYTEGGLDYDKFCSHIDSVVLDLSTFIRLNGIQSYKTAGRGLVDDLASSTNTITMINGSSNAAGDDGTYVRWNDANTNPSSPRPSFVGLDHEMAHIQAKWNNIVMPGTMPALDEKIEILKYILCIWKIK